MKNIWQTRGITHSTSLPQMLSGLMSRAISAPLRQHSEIHGITPLNGPPMWTEWADLQWYSYLENTSCAKTLHWSRPPMDLEYPVWCLELSWEIPGLVMIFRLHGVCSSHCGHWVAISSTNTRLCTTHIVLNLGLRCKIWTIDLLWGIAAHC